MHTDPLHSLRFLGDTDKVPAANFRLILLQSFCTFSCRASCRAKAGSCTFKGLSNFAHRVFFGKTFCEGFFGSGSRAGSGSGLLPPQEKKFRSVERCLTDFITFCTECEIRTI